MKPPFFKACSSGNKSIVKYLIERGADINIDNKIIILKHHYLKHV